MGFYKDQAVATGSTFPRRPVRTRATSRTLDERRPLKRHLAAPQPVEQRHTRGGRTGLLGCNNLLAIL
jgi:hypothetical protein